MSQPAFSRQETALDEFKLRLNADLQPGAKKKPFLEVRFLKNQPSLTVTTNVPEDAAKNHGKIRAGLDAHTFFALLRLIEEVATSTERDIAETMPSMDCVGKNFRNGGKIETTEQVLVGKKDGRVYIAITAFGRPKIPFYFGPSDYHGMTMRDGSAADNLIVSKCFTLGWVDMLRNLVPNLQVTEYVKRDEIMSGWGNNNGGGNGGGQQSQWGNKQNNNGGQQKQWNNNGGGQQNAAADFEDDIPF